jgi:hypothetical protein
MVETRAVERLNCMVRCIRVVVRRGRGTLGGREDLGRLWDVGLRREIPSTYTLTLVHAYPVRPG